MLSKINKEKSTNAISLEESALNTLLSNRVVETYYYNDLVSKQDQDQEQEHADANTNTLINDDNGDKIEMSYIASCSNIKNMQESTTTLLSARALAKAGYSNYAWEAIDSLFAVQGSNGFVPRYRYPPDYNNMDCMSINNCYPFPPSPLFNITNTNLDSTAYSSTSSSSSSIGLIGSGRIAAAPFHSTYILDVFYLSNQTDHDINQLSNNFNKLYNYHKFTHEMFGHNTPGDDKSILFNIVHPWESEIEIYNPFWKDVLQPIITIMNHKQWINPYYGNIGDVVKLRADYPGDDIYNATIFLLQCIENCTALYVNDDDDDDGTKTLEQLIIIHCPFAMVDIPFLSALSHSDKALMEIGNILRDKDDSNSPSQEKTFEMNIWADLSSSALDTLYNYDVMSFLPRIVDTKDNNNNDHSTDTINFTNSPIKIPTIHNFMAFYGKEINDPVILQSLAFQLLGGNADNDNDNDNDNNDHNSDFSFNCAEYPLWTYGCNYINDINNYDTITISPLLNYWISDGLINNVEQHYDGLTSLYIRNSTLNLICGLPNNELSNYTDSCPNKNIFGSSYNVMDNYQPLCVDKCSQSWSITAATIYDSLAPDKPFEYTNAPPLTNVGVLILIVLELAFALCTGIGCLVLSLNIMRRLNADDEFDTLVRSLHRLEDVAGVDTLDDLYGVDSSRRESRAGSSDNEYDTSNAGEEEVLQL